MLGTIRINILRTVVHVVIGTDGTGRAALSFEKSYNFRYTNLLLYIVEGLNFVDTSVTGVVQWHILYGEICMYVSG